jgi:hypothetical protein
MVLRRSEENILAIPYLGQEVTEDVFLHLPFFFLSSSSVSSFSLRLTWTGKGVQ